MTYESHPLFEDVDEDRQIWRYMSLEKFAWMVLTRQLHFHRIGDFPDSFEGTVPRAMKQLRDQQLRSIGEEQAEFLVKSFENLIPYSRLITFVNSWHANEFEDVAMWRVYGRENKSIAIKSTIGGLIQSVEPIDRDIFVGPVQYVDFYSDWEDLSDEDQGKIIRIFRNSGLNSLQPSILKRTEFSYESEVRAVFSDMANSEPSPPFEIREVNPEPKRDYYNFSADIESLIDKIVYDPDAKKWFIDTLEMLVDHSPTKLSTDIIVPSEMDRDPWY